MCKSRHECCNKIKKHNEQHMMDLATYNTGVSHHGVFGCYHVVLNCSWGREVSHIFPIQGHSTLQGIIFRFLCLKQGITFPGHAPVPHTAPSAKGGPAHRLPSTTSFSLISCAFVENVWKHKLMYRLFSFGYGSAWSSLEQGKEQHSTFS